MADLIRGKIEETSKRTTDSGVDIWTFTIGGKRYTAFDQELAEQFAPGDYVEAEIQVKKKGNRTYKNIISMQKVDPEPKLIPGGNGKAPPPRASQLQLRALELALFAAPEGTDPATVLRYAQDFWTWLTGQRVTSAQEEKPAQALAQPQRKAAPSASGSGPAKVLEAKLKAAGLEEEVFLEWLAMEGITDGLCTHLAQLTAKEAQAAVNQFGELVQKYQGVIATS